MLTVVDRPVPDLIVAAQKGDAEAFTALCQMYGNTVRRMAYLQLGDRGLAEEVTQDVFMQVYRHLQRYDSNRGTFVAWLRRITVRRCSNARRPLWRRWISLDQEVAAGMEREAAMPEPPDVAIDNEQQRAVFRTVLQLSEPLKVVTILRFYHNLSYEEIADTLECPVGTVKSRIYAARKQLAQLLGEDVNAYP